jgi:hypothetical protein
MHRQVARAGPPDYIAPLTLNHNPSRRPPEFIFDIRARRAMSADVGRFQAVGPLTAPVSTPSHSARPADSLTSDSIAGRGLVRASRTARFLLISASAPAPPVANNFIVASIKCVDGP